MKHIIIISGTSEYHALNIFAEELTKGFRLTGCQCTHLQLNPASEFISADELCQILRQTAKEKRTDLIISINGITVDIMENPSLRNELPDTVLAFYVDHPFYHHTRIQNSFPACYSLFVDDTFTRFASEIYPECHAAGTIHQAGIISEKSDKPFSDRKKRLCFFGTCRDLKAHLKSLENSPLEVLMTNLIEYGLNHPDKTIEEIITEKIYELEQKRLTREEMSAFSACISNVEGFLRGYYREEIIRTLAANEIEIDIYGNGWENLSIPGKENLHCFPPVSYTKMADIMTEYQFTLNVLPWAKAGFHDRLATGMLNGCMCITDSSSYIEDEQLDKKGVLVYRLSKETEIIPKIKYYLSHTKEAQEEAEKSKEYALKNHTWKNRAEQILSLLNTFPANR